MDKFKIAFFISLLIVLMVSIGSISAEDINSDECQILDANINEDISLNDGLFVNSDLNSNNALDEDIIESDDFDNGIDSSDEEIAENIKVNFSHTVYANDTGNITVELPDDASGNLIVAIDDEEIYNQSITDKSVQIPIVIPKPKFPYLVVNKGADNSNIVINGNWDYTMHMVSIFYNEISLNLTDNLLKVMKYPTDYGFYLSVPQEVLKDDNQSHQSFGLIFPSSANGTVEIYIDDELFEILNASQYTFLNISKINCLDLGNHKIKAIYSGDEYYGPCERNSTFKIVDFLIEIPSNISLDHNDCIYARSVKYTDGFVNVYFDGKKIFSKKLDESHEFLESLFSKVTCGEHLIEVEYNSSKFNYSKQ